MTRQRCAQKTPAALTATVLTAVAVLGALLVVTLPHGAAADETTAPQMPPAGPQGGDGRAPEPFAGFAEICPYPLVFAPTRQSAVATHDALAGEIIVLDPALADPSNAFHLAFLAAHECAHHRLGHTRPEARLKRSQDPRVVVDQELSADCMAAEMLARNGRQADAAIMVERFFRGGFYSPGAGYPSGLQRSLIVRQCGSVTAQMRGVVPPVSFD